MVKQKISWIFNGLTDTCSELLLCSIEMKILNFLFFRQPQSWAGEHSTSVDETWKSQTSFELTDEIFTPTTEWILHGTLAQLWNHRTNLWSAADRLSQFLGWSDPVSGLRSPLSESKKAVRQTAPCWMRNFKLHVLLRVAMREVSRISEK